MSSWPTDISSSITQVVTICDMWCGTQTFDVCSLTIGSKLPKVLPDEFGLCEGLCKGNHQPGLSLSGVDHRF